MKQEQDKGSTMKCGSKRDQNCKQEGRVYLIEKGTIEMTRT